MSPLTNKQSGSNVAIAETIKMPKVLIVDDDDAVRGLLCMRLSDTYQIIETGDPEQALALALEHKPDAILLDLLMPENQ